jgi:hypothetical protein
MASSWHHHGIIMASSSSSSSSLFFLPIKVFADTTRHTQIHQPTHIPPPPQWLIATLLTPPLKVTYLKSLNTLGGRFGILEIDKAKPSGGSLFILPP